MPDFRLKVFATVTKHLSFTKASEELFISQPAVTKNIKELEKHLGSTLFLRKGTKIKLTPAGEIYHSYVLDILKKHQEAQFKINELKGKFTGDLKLGASTTFGQYIFPKILAQFLDKYPEINISMLNENTEDIEKKLIEGTLDLGVIEGRSKRPQLKYIPIMDDEIVAVVAAHHNLSKKIEITKKEIEEYPLALRESGSGSLEVLLEYLSKNGINIKNLNVEIKLGSTESIKNYLIHSNCIAFLSVSSIGKEVLKGHFKILDIKGLSLERKFYAIHPHGSLSEITEKFLEFLVHNHKL